MLRLALVFALLAAPALAQDRRPSHCIAIAEAALGGMHLRGDGVAPDPAEAEA